jgi:AbrB family looped-hinge helix DNA binding protein
MTTRLSTKGQVILPKTIRQSRDWRPGARLTVEDTSEGVLLKAAPLFSPTTVEAVFGVLAWTEQPRTIEEMDAAILAEARRRHEAGE